MFGKINPEKLIAKGSWDKLNASIKKMSDEELIKTAQACANSHTDQSYNLLVSILDVPSKPVQVAAVRALGDFGRDGGSTFLLRMLNGNVDEDLAEEIRLALNKIRNKK